MTHSSPSPPGVPPTFPTYTAYVEALSHGRPEQHHVTALLRGGLITGTLNINAIEAIARPATKSPSQIVALGSGLIVGVALFQAAAPLIDTAASAFAPFGLAAIGVMAIIERVIVSPP